MGAIVLPVPPGGCRVSCRLGMPCLINSARRVAVPAAPAAVKIELTSRCNYRCATCANQLRIEDRGEMRWPLFTRLVGEMVDSGVRELGLSYIGEPFLYDWLADAIEYAKARGIEYAFLATNGSLATATRVKKCLDAGLDLMQFTIDYADEGDFEAHAGVPADLFRYANANLRVARRLRDEGGYACGLYATSVRSHGERQQRLQARVSETLPYVDEHYWLAAYSTGPHRRNGRGVATVPAVPCATLFTEAHVTHDGKLSACRFEAGQRFAMADLSEVAFLDGWSSPRFVALREAHLRGDVARTVCEHCVVEKV